MVPRSCGSSMAMQHMRVPTVHFPGVPPAGPGVRLACDPPVACGLLLCVLPIERDLPLVWDVGMAWDVVVAAATAVRRAAKVTILASMVEGGRGDWCEEESD